METLHRIIARITSIITPNLWRHNNDTKEPSTVNLQGSSLDELQLDLLEKIPDAVILTDKNFNVQFANATAREIFSDRKIKQLTLQSLFPDSRFLKLLDEAIITKKEVTEKLILPQQASPMGARETRGINVWLVHMTPFPTESKFGIQCLLRDLTTEYQSEQIRKDFVANASHELRTPLSIIKGYLENLLEPEGLQQQEQAQRMLQIMDKHTERISRIVDDMLMIARLESSDSVLLNTETFLVADCIHDVMERLEHLVQSNQATVKIQIEPDTLTLRVDRFYITQVLFNIIENALKQNPNLPLKLKIEACQRDNKTEISVADNGIGIPTQHLPYIFKRFYRVDQAHTNSAIKGTGLGLSIVKRAIEAHGGTIAATSTPGIETKFTISLPANTTISTGV